MVNSIRHHIKIQYMTMLIELKIDCGNISEYMHTFYVSKKASKEIDPSLTESAALGLAGQMHVELLYLSDIVPVLRIGEVCTF